MADPLAELKLDVPCPNCEHAVQVSLAQVDRGDAVHCAGCDKDIVLSADNAWTKEVRRSLNDLARTIKNFNLNIRTK